MPKPTIIILPGAAHTLVNFAPLCQTLKLKGYEVHVLSLHALTQTPAITSLEPDIHSLRTAIRTATDAGKGVINGIVVSGASLSDLSIITRRKERKRGGVVKLGFISAFIPSAGVSLLSSRGGAPSPAWVISKTDSGEWVTFRDPKGLLYHNLPPHEAEHWVTEIRPHSYKTFEAAFETEASWVEIESCYLVCEDDKAIPVEFQESMVREARDRGAIMDVVRVGGGHSPFFGSIDEVVGWIEGMYR